MAGETLEALRAENARLLNTNACLINDTVLMGLARDAAERQRDRHVAALIEMTALARELTEALREVDNDILAAGYRAMFADEWDGTQAAMMGAGWDAMINAALARLSSDAGKEG